MTFVGSRKIARVLAVAVMASVFVPANAQTLNPIACLSENERTSLLSEIATTLRPFGGMDAAPIATQMRDVAARIPAEQKKLAECRGDVVNTLLGGQCSADTFRLNSSMEEFKRLSDLLQLRNSLVVNVRNKYRAC